MKKIEMQNSKGETFTAYDNSWALVIGINNYSDEKIPSLNYATEDAKAIAKLLEEMDFPKENITLLLNEDATLNKVKETISAIGAKTGKNDRLLVYWAGHGETESLPRGGEMGYLITYDGNPSAMYSTCLSMDEIKRLSERVAAKHVLFLMDACYGGLSAVASRALPKETEMYLEQVTSAEAIQIITAGTKDQQVVESSSWGHSAFAKSIIDGFKTKLVDRDNNGVVTADELYAYLGPKVFELSSSENGGKGHRPVFANLKSSEGQFAFVVAVQEFELTLNELPEQNTVYVNGKKISENKKNVLEKFKKGQYSIEIESPKYQRYSTSIELAENRTLTPELVAIIQPEIKVTEPIIPSFLEVEVSPSDAMVFADGNLLGTVTVQSKFSIERGEHEIEIVKDGFATQEYSVKILNGETKNLKVTLEEKSASWWYYGGGAILGGVTYFLVKKSPEKTKATDLLGNPPALPINP
jgi:uncharacterized caspase-like protein